MMGKKYWKEEYSRKIIKDLDLKSKLQTDLDFMLENKITESEEFKENFSNLSKILKEFNFQVEYDESTKKFKTNFEEKTGHNLSLVVPLPDRRTPDRTRGRTEQPNVENERILAENTKLKEKISQLESENLQLKKSEKTKNIENQNLNDKISQLQSDNLQLKNSENAKNSQNQNLKEQIKNLQNELELEKLFQKPTKDEEKKVIEQFQNFRNIYHHIPQYQIKVKYLYFFSKIFCYSNFFRELSKSKIQNC